MDAAVKLARVYHTTELADMIGWPRRKLLRRLLKMNAECGGRLLRNVGTPQRPRWTTTLDALRMTAPQWFRDDETIEARLDDLEDARAHDARLIQAQTRRICELSERVQMLDVTTSLLRQSLHAIVGPST